MSKTLHAKTWSKLLAAALLCGGLNAYATSTEAPAAVPQSSERSASVCTGEVLDDLGDPLVGATVRVAGTTIAAATDLDGRFSLSGVKPGQMIQVNYIGYDQATVQWDGRPLVITLSESSTKLDEVVVMGYGIQQKRANVTNSISKVSEETLTIGANANPAQALAGAVAGVKVKVTSGDPGATPSIVVRGGTNFDGSGSPVVVVDGQIRESLADINPNDIGDMQILKDAGATALYGARAANGVILITTKQGSKGHSKIDLNVKYGLNYYNNPGYSFVDASEYIRIYREAWQNNKDWNAKTNAGFYAPSENNSPFGIAGTQVTSSTVYNILKKTSDNAYLLQKGWQEMKDPITDNTILYKDTDPLGYNLNDPAITQDYNLSFSGGNENGTYYASLGYYDADGALYTTFYKRYNFAFTGSYKIAPWLEANSTFNYIRSNYLSNPAMYNTEFFFGRLLSLPHTMRLDDEDGNPLYGNEGLNLHFQPEKFKRDYQTDKFSMTQALTVRPIDGLSIKGTMSWFYSEYLGEAFNRDYQSNQVGTTWNRQRSSSASFYRYFDQTYNLVANYAKTFNRKHDINVMLGTEYYDRAYKSISASGSNAPSDHFQDLDLTFAGQQDPYMASTRSVGSAHGKMRIISFMGRAEYNYDSKYHVAATFRKDGYSQLINNKWGFFPGVSAGWTFSNEKFWKENPSLEFINYGKIRASYGLNGLFSTSAVTSEDNPSVAWYALQGAYSAYMYNGNYGYRISSLANPDLRWEKTRTFEVGLDFAFLQNRLNFSLTYYNRLTSDKYAQLSLPQTTGFSSVPNNNGKLRNQGVEMEFNGTLVRTRDITWTFGANLTYNKNIVVELPENGLVNNRQGGTEVYTGEPMKDGAYPTVWIGGTQEGQEPMHLIGYKSNHMLRSEADVKAMGNYIDISQSCPIYATEEGYARLKAMGKTANAKPLRPGDMVFCDRNGDDMIDVKDRYDLGNMLPHWTGGFNTSVTWKGLTLYSRWDVGFGFYVWDSPMTWWLGGSQGTFSFPTQIYDTWREDNPNAKLPRYTLADQIGAFNYNRTSDITGSTGAYMACRELSLSYQLPMSICSKFYCKGLRVSVTGQNLGYIKKTTLPLPDYVAATSTSNAGTYNLPQTVLFGLNVSF